jgi:hypothetical protein
LERLPHIRASRNYGRVVLRWLFAIVIAGILSAFAFLLLTGEYVNDGPVLVALSEEHGIHKGDVFVVTGWTVALLSEAGLLLVGARRDG